MKVELMIHRSAYLIETKEFFAPFYAMWGNQLSPTQKKALSRTQPCWYLDLKLQDSKIIINKFPLFISYLVCGPLLRTKTMTLVNTTTDLQWQIKVSENSSFFLKAQILFAIILQVFLEVIDRFTLLIFEKMSAKYPNMNSHSLPASCSYD